MVSELQEKVNSLSSVVNRLDVSFSAVDSRVDGVNKKAEQASSKASAAAVRLAKLESLTSSLGKGGTGSPRNKANTDLNKLKQTVDRLEKAVAAQQQSTNTSTTGAKGSTTSAPAPAPALIEAQVETALEAALKKVKADRSALEVRLGNQLKQRDATMSKLKIQNRNLANEHSRDRNKAEAALAAARKELNEDISKINGQIEELQAAIDGITSWQTEHETKIATLGSSSTTTSSSSTAVPSNNTRTGNRNRTPGSSLDSVHWARAKAGDGSKRAHALPGNLSPIR